MSYNKIIKPILLLSAILMGMVGCEYDAPTEIWNPELPAGAQSPTITNVLPENEAIAGINEINIIGENFSPDMEKNTVYVNGAEVALKRASATELTMFRPNIEGTDLTISVAVEGALLIAQHSPYAIEHTYDEYGGFVGTDNIWGFDLDKDENLYAILSASDGKWMVKTEPDQFKFRYFEVDIRTGNEIILAPGNKFCVARNKNYLQIISAENPAGERFGSIDWNVWRMDYDEAGNMATCGQKSDFGVILQDGTGVGSDVFEGYNLNAIRVFNGYIYVGGKLAVDADNVKIGVWRVPLNSTTGEVGASEQVLDITTVAGYEEAEVYALEFGIDGTLYVGTDGGDAEVAGDPIIVKYPDGLVEVFYPGIIGGAAEKLIWGNTNYLYMWRTGSQAIQRILRLKMNQNGAPRYARNL